MTANTRKENTEGELQCVYMYIYMYTVALAGPSGAREPSPRQCMCCLAEPACRNKCLTTPSAEESAYGNAAAVRQSPAGLLVEVRCPFWRNHAL